MAIRRIRQLGDPILRVRCEQVQDPKSPSVRLVADDLRDTLRSARTKYKMGRALAAPQIGAPVRVVFVEVKGKQRWTMVNPEITDVGSQDFLVWDDCFSFPNLLVRVTRARLSGVVSRGESPLRGQAPALPGGVCLASEGRSPECDV